MLYFLKYRNCSFTMFQTKATIQQWLALVLASFISFTSLGFGVHILITVYTDLFNSLDSQNQLKSSSLPSPLQFSHQWDAELRRHSFFVFFLTTCNFWKSWSWCLSVVHLFTEFVVFPGNVNFKIWEKVLMQICCSLLSYRKLLQSK